MVTKTQLRKMNKSELLDYIHSCGIDKSIDKDGNEVDLNDKMKLVDIKEHAFMWVLFGNNNTPLTEDTGLIWECALCDLSNIKYKGKFKYSMDEVNSITKMFHPSWKEKFSKLKIEHTAKNQSKHDFTMYYNDRKIYISAKSSKQRIAKVAPQENGQMTKKTFRAKYNIDSDNLIKNYIENNVKKLLREFEINTFGSPVLYYNKCERQCFFIKLIKSIEWDQEKITFTHREKAKEWNSSTTIKLGGKAIIESQVHRTRNGVVNRWHLNNLLVMFKDNFKIINMNEEISDNMFDTLW